MIEKIKKFFSKPVIALDLIAFAVFLIHLSIMAGAAILAVLRTGKGEDFTGAICGLLILISVVLTYACGAIVNVIGLLVNLLKREPLRYSLMLLSLYSLEGLLVIINFHR